MPEQSILEPAQRQDAALLDTSAVIDLDQLVDHPSLPARLAICSITLAELAAGPQATDDPLERARRQDRLQRVEASFDPIPFDVAAARAYGQVFAAVVAAGRQPRRRFADLLIASVAVAEGVPLLTRNPDEFAGLDGVLTVIAV